MEKRTYTLNYWKKQRHQAQEH